MKTGLGSHQFIISNKFDFELQKWGHNNMRLFRVSTAILITLFFLGCNYSHKNEEIILDEATVTEIVIYRTKPGIQKQDHLRKSEAISPILSKLEGFISRQFNQAADGRWVDIINWKSLESAEKAAKAVKNIPACNLFFSDIDRVSIEFMYVRPLLYSLQGKSALLPKALPP